MEYVNNFAKEVILMKSKKKELKEIKKLIKKLKKNNPIKVTIKK